MVFGTLPGFATTSPPLTGEDIDKLVAKGEYKTFSSLVLPKEDVPESIGYEAARDARHVVRLYEEELDPYTVIFANSDGTRTLYMFNSSVKYTDEAGRMVDKSLEFAPATGGAFTSARSDIQTHFPADVRQGVVVAYGKYRISMTPEVAETTKVSPPVSNGRRVSYANVWESAELRYELTYDGVKEEIVLSRYTGQTEFSFILDLHGLKLTESGGQFVFLDEKGEVAGLLQDFWVYTADQRNNTFADCNYKLLDDGTYRLTLSLPEEYFLSPDTMYPLLIDPTITWNGASAMNHISDRVISTTGSYVSPTLASLYIGRETNTTSRTLMRFPGLESYINDMASVSSATISIRDLMCYSWQTPVICSQYNGMIWNHSTSFTSSNYTSYWNFTTPSVGPVNVSYSDGVSVGHRYSFNITNIVSSWLSNSTKRQQGIIFRSNAESTQNTYAIFASVDRTSNQPEFVITYTAHGSGGSSFSTAQTMSLNTSYTVHITASNQKKYFAFTPATDGFYSFISSNNTGDPRGWLYNNGQNSLADDDDGAGNLNYRVTYHLRGGALYYFEAGCFSTGTGSYTLRVISTNTTSHNLRNVSVLSSSANVSIGTPFQRRYFSFTPLVSGNYTFESYNITNNADPFIWLCNANLAQIAFNDDGGVGTNFRLTHNLVAGQTYYIAAGCWSNKTGNYKMVVSIFNGTTHTLKSTSYNTFLSSPSDHVNNRFVTADVASNGNPRGQKQLWRFEWYNSDYFFIACDSPGTDDNKLYLTANSDTGLNQRAFQYIKSSSRLDRQLWRLILQADGTYYIQSKNLYDINSNLYLRINSSNQVVQSSNTSYTKWQVKPLQNKLHIYYDRGFVDRWATYPNGDGARGFINDMLYTRYNNGRTFAQAMYEDFGILMRYEIINTSTNPFQSFPVANNCLHHSGNVTVLNKICTNNLVNGSNCNHQSTAQQLISNCETLHHKRDRSIFKHFKNAVNSASSNFTSTCVDVLISGYDTCGVKDGVHRTIANGRGSLGGAYFAVYHKDSPPERQRRTLIHELFHNYDVPHCFTDPCIMGPNRTHRDYNNILMTNLTSCSTCQGIVNSEKHNFYNH